MAKLLGWGEVTVIRFLNGQIPSKEYSDRLKSLEDPMEFFDLLQKNKEVIANGSFERIAEKFKLAVIDITGAYDYSAEIPYGDAGITGNLGCGMQETALRLLRYQVDKIEFNLNANYIHNKKEPIALNQSLTRIIDEIDDGKFKVSLKFDIYNDNSKEDMPFTLSAAVSGIFELEKWKEGENKFLSTVNTVAILFPFLRTLVTTITLGANIPPYIIPAVNVAQRLDNKGQNN